MQRSRYHPVHRGLAATASTGTARQRCTPNPRPVSGANRRGLLGGVHGSGYAIRGSHSPNHKIEPLSTPFSRWLRGHIRRGACSSGFHHPPIRCERSPTDSSASTPCGAGTATAITGHCDGGSSQHLSYLAHTGRSWHLSRLSDRTCRRLPGFNGPFTLHHSGYEPHSLVGAKHSSADAFSSSAVPRRNAYPPLMSSLPISLWRWATLTAVGQIHRGVALPTAASTS